MLFRSVTRRAPRVPVGRCVGAPSPRSVQAAIVSGWGRSLTDLTARRPLGHFSARQPLSRPPSAMRRTLASKAGDYPEHTLITVPALSPTMTTGNIGQWKKKIGDQVTAGDVLCEIETDKAQMDFECQEEGFLARIFIDAGAKDVAVNTPLAVLAESADDVAAFKDFEAPAGPAVAAAAAAPEAAETAEASGATTAAAAPETAGSRVRASPLAKTVANQRGVAVGDISGTGPLGRVVRRDVEAFDASAAAKPAAAAAPATTGMPAFEDIQLSNMRKVIAGRLLQSKQEIPHYYLTAAIRLEKALKLRAVLNAQADGRYKLSVNDLIVKASALALQRVPQVNSAWHGTFIRQYRSADVSVAVATEAGLITPIVRGAEARGLASISNSIKELSARAKENKLKPDEYQGGTFTISNLGMMGISQFTAIINPPQSCILAVGEAAKVAVPCGESPSGVRFEDQVRVTLSCDHRVVDGAVGSQWLAAFRGYLEEPLSMML